MTRDWTIGRKIGLVFTLVFCVLVATGAAGIWGARNIKANLDETVGTTARRLELAIQAQGLSTAMFFEERSLILATITGDAELYKRAAGRLATELKQFDEGTAEIATLAHDDADRDTTARLRTSMAQWAALDKSLVEMLAAKQAVEAHVKSDKEGRPIREALRKDFEALIASQRATLKADSALAQKVFVRSVIILIVMLAGAVALGVLIVYTVRRMNRDLGAGLAELSTGAKQVVSASTQVASSAQSLSQGATEQAASLEETSASMEEMASMTRRNAENSHDAASQMAETERLVSGANRALADLVTSMTQIRESSGQVTKIIKTIDEIAFQTNILALNAAVEAARAGEAGMGFAVVADEVRNLAQRSAQAAKDTAALIEASATNASAGGEKVDAVVAAMSAITTSSGRVRGLVEEVSLASRQQSQGIDQVTQAITQMEKVTQTTAATAEESAAASEELNAQAEQTLSILRRLEHMVRHDADRDAPQSARARNVVSMKRAGKPTPATPADHADLRPTGTYGSF